MFVLGRHMQIWQEIIWLCTLHLDIQFQWGVSCLYRKSLVRRLIIKYDWTKALDQRSYVIYPPGSPEIFKNKLAHFMNPRSSYPLYTLYKGGISIFIIDQNFIKFSSASSILSFTFLKIQNSNPIFPFLSTLSSPTLMLLSHKDKLNRPKYPPHLPAVSGTKGWASINESTMVLRALIDMKGKVVEQMDIKFTYQKATGRETMVGKEGKDGSREMEKKWKRNEWLLPFMI